MISVKNLSYQYPEGEPIAFENFEITRGEHCLLLGESGCGKTTLLHLLGGLLRGAKGNIAINNVELSSLSEPALDDFRKKHLGFVFQKNHLITALNVQQNLLLTTNDSSRADELLSSLDLAQLKSKRVTTLSHGQAQRVAIARALMNKPKVILADEPTSALDDKNCNAVVDLLLNVAKDNQCTLVIATHDSRLKSKFHRQIQMR
ncbi:MAG: ATP-binding cassette domain-containing protein [Bacteroidota bacterium]